MGEEYCTYERGEHVMISVVVHLKLQNLKKGKNKFLLETTFWAARML